MQPGEGARGTDSREVDDEIASEPFTMVPEETEDGPGGAKGRGMNRASEPSLNFFV